MWNAVRRFLSLWMKRGFLLLVFSFFAGVGGLSIIVWQVYFGDTTILKKSTILAKIKEETTIYYLDGETSIGSIFENAHRKYIPFEEIPKHMIDAIVAAEDKNFYDHFGVDPVAIGKAFAEGLLNRGRFRRGGSTITQQTVKNIMGDWEASFARKFRELIKSFQIERMYSKQQILEFYLNQFHVAGNGNGIGIAVKYYFNKEVKDLTLVESAFIAGSVKGPSKYNPFIKYTKTTKERAFEYAFDRKNYVLGRMFEQKDISQEAYEEALKESVPFNRGEFRTAEVSLVELIKEQIAKKEILDALGIKDPSDINIAGLKVYTTLDADLQNAAQYAMRKNLSRLETILQGFKPEDPSRYKPSSHLIPQSFVYGKVDTIEGTSPKDYQIRMSFGLATGVILNDALVRYAKLLDLPDGKGYLIHLQELINQIKPGDVLLTEILDYKEDTLQAILELHRKPVVSGGLVTLDKGEVRTAISGFETLGYNRAIQAKRQPGSVFKSLLFFAGLQLGWSVIDRLENVRQIFPYQGRFYFPRPDHISPYENISMLWAGVMSENLGAVSMGARLVEKLNFDQFKELMGFLGLLPEAGEVPRDFHYRVARKTGVSIDNAGIKAFQLTNAINELAPDLVFAGEEPILKKIRLMWWGDGWAGELNRIYQAATTAVSMKEARLRIELVINNFQRILELKDSLRTEWDKITAALKVKTPRELLALEEYRQIFDKFRYEEGSTKPRLIYYPSLLGTISRIKENRSDLLPEIPGRPLTLKDIEVFWETTSDEVATADAADRPRDALSDVKISGYLPFKFVQRLETDIEQLFENATKNTDPYSLNRYFEHHDFRIGLGLTYVAQMSKAAGVYSKLEPVLSFPLGTNDVTTSEVAKAYQTFISGRTYQYYKDGPANQINMIKKIEDRFGHVLFEPKMITHQLVKPEVAYQMREILRKTVTHGTGRRAKGELFVTPIEGDPNSKIRVPAFGKTGTTNDFRTSYFAGFLPYPTAKGKELNPDDSYVIAVYVGYDFNKSMTRGRQRIFGGSGALPVWTDFAKEIIKIKKYVDKIDPLDLNMISKKEWPIKTSGQPILVDLARGTVMRTSKDGDSEAWNATDLAKTGETFQSQDEFAETQSSVVYLPGSIKGESWQSARLFSLFAPLKGQTVVDMPNAEPTPAKSEEDTSLDQPLPTSEDDPEQTNATVPPTSTPDQQGEENIW